MNPNQSQVGFTSIRKLEAPVDRIDSQLAHEQSIPKPGVQVVLSRQNNASRKIVAAITTPAPDGFDAGVNPALIPPDAHMPRQRSHTVVMPMPQAEGECARPGARAV